MNSIGKEQILQTASLMFAKFGLKRTSIDEICRSIGMSKRTFYLFYKDKDQLITEFVESLCINDCSTLPENFSKNDVIQNFKEFDRNLTNLWKVFYPVMVLDLRRYYTAAYPLFIQKRANMMANLESIIEQGKQQGVFRGDINSKIIAELRFIELETILSMSQQIKLNQLQAKQQELLIHYLAGIISK